MLARRKLLLKKSRKGKTGNKGSNPSPSALNYKGPIVDKAQRVARDVTVFELQWNADLVASSGGVIDFVVSNDPNVGFVGYSSIKGYYNEVRCLAMEVIFCPNNKFYAPSTTAIAPLYVAVCHQFNINPFTSYDEAAENVNCTPEDMMHIWKRTIKMIGAEESQWQKVNGTSATFSVKAYGSGYTASANVGRLLVRGRFQFLDRGFG